MFPLGDSWLRLYSQFLLEGFAQQRGSNGRKLTQGNGRFLTHPGDVLPVKPDDFKVVVS